MATEISQRPAPARKGPKRAARPAATEPKRRQQARSRKASPKGQARQAPNPIDSDYSGLITLARNSGQVTSINAQAVHRNDRFAYAFGLNERLEHVPAEGDRGEITHFYAYVKFKDGGHHFDVMSKAEMDAVRDRAGKLSETAWENGYTEMGKEAVLLRIARFLPLSAPKAAADLPEAKPQSPLAPPPSVDPAEPELDPDLEQLFLAFPPHVLSILDAIAVYGVPEGALPGIIGMPLEDVPEESEEEILRALAEWEAPLDPFEA